MSTLRTRADADALKGWGDQDAWSFLWIMEKRGLIAVAHVCGFNFRNTKAVYVSKTTALNLARLGLVDVRKCRPSPLYPKGGMLVRVTTYGAALALAGRA